MSKMTPITYENAEPLCNQLNLTLLRSGSDTRPALFEHGYLQDHYVAIAVIQKAFTPWASPTDQRDHLLIEIPPSDALKARDAFLALAEISPDAFTRSHEFDHIPTTLKRAAEEEITVLISQE